MPKHPEPGAFYGVNVKGADRAVRVGTDRPAGGHKSVEKTMNVPFAKQIPVEGAVTGPDAPPASVDELYGHLSLEELEARD